MPTRPGADDAELPAVALSVTVEELTTTVARYLGEERTRASFESFAAARRISLDPKSEADFQLLRYAEHLLASAIGAASSRLVLSLLLRKRTVSTKAALKLLDDANAAIHYNREILQTALDHVRQGIAVFNKELQLICWNRQFGEILDLPPAFTRVGHRSRRNPALPAPAQPAAPAPVEAIVHERMARYVSAASRSWSASPSAAWWWRCAPTAMPDGGMVTTFTDITPSVEAAEALERANETLERRVRERTEELTRLNAELARAKAEAEEANISKTRFLAAASHDILQPLNAARLYVTSLVERQGDGEDAPLVGNIDASLEAVEEIFGALLDISRLDTGAMKPELVSFRIAELLRQLEVEFAPLAREKGLELDFRPLPRDDALRPPAAAPAAAESGLQCHQIHAERPRAGRLPPARRDSCASTSTTPGSASRIRANAPCSRNSTASSRAPRWRAGSGSAFRSSTASGACSTTRSTSNPMSGAARISASRCRCRRTVASAQSQREVVAHRSWPARRRGRAVHRQRAVDPRRHGGVAGRLGLPGAQGDGSRRRHRSGGRGANVAERPAGRLPSRQRQWDRGNRRAAPALRRRPAGDFDHRRPQPARARGRARRTDIQVLNKPLKPAALRALLAQWRVQRVAAAE